MAEVLTEARQVQGQRAAIGNRGALGGGCGCFHCLGQFRAERVTAWTDDGQTALCPLCGMDAVVPAEALQLGLAELEALKRRWFKPPHERTTA